ncbi:MAG TPA: TIGR00730 family Rossman fold protein [Acidimicrobiales bacterium]
MSDLRSLCVYCGSSMGRDPAHASAAAELGALLARRGVRLVYGGAAIGLMGVLADAVMDGGGEVLGVMPVGLFSSEIGHTGITELVEVTSMHERKQRMAEEADAFLALPGGLGTLEELAEIVTWAQLGIHAKPVGVLDIGDFWRPLLGFLDQAVDAGFLQSRNRELVVRVTDVDEVLEVLGAARTPTNVARLGPAET